MAEREAIEGVEGITEVLGLEQLHLLGGRSRGRGRGRGRGRSRG